MESVDNLKRAKGILMIAIFLGILALAMSIFKNIITERWLKQKNNVACVPADVENSHPMVYRQTAYNPVQSDAYVKSFVEEYIRLTQNEQIVDYHKLSADKRYDNARLSEAKWKAIELSSGVEKAMNMEKYANSSDQFRMLNQGNLGWVFLIDDLLLFNLADGSTMAVVRGEFQVTFDKIKTDLPPQLWGYREILLIIEQGFPIEGEEDNDYVNQYGLFVKQSQSTTITPEQKEKLARRNKDYYLMEEIK